MRTIRFAPIVAAMAVAIPCAAQTTPTHYQLTTDVPATLGSVTVEDADIVDQNAGSAAFTVLHNLASVLPPGVGVDAVTCFPNGDVAFSTDTSFGAGSVTADDEDVLLLSGGVLTLLFDGSAHGIPASADVDAVHVIDRSSPVLLLSFDTDVTLGGTTYADDDIVRFDGAAGSFALELGGSAWLGAEAGRADVDGVAAALGNPVRYFLTTDVTFITGTLPAAEDEDIVTVTNGSVTGIRNMSALGIPSAHTDIDGLDLQFAPALSLGAVSHQIVNTATPVTWSVVYTDQDNDPPAAGLPTVSLDSGTPVTMAADSSGCGALCDGVPWNGERFIHTATVGAGATHTYAFAAGDGIDQATASGTGPSYVSVPGDADGDGDVDATDLARIVVENHDTNGGTDLDLVRGGSVTDSWGGTDANSDHAVTTTDLSAALGTIF